ncbi:MAG: nickel pincer cofactor biosynthesis protein LarC [Syntrophomonas sp.]|nr:nickel pincer cofactor biosynthesis protein LarC [Syntrophomonas sp.]
MSFLYFDCFSGVSGDMIIGALLDCGASFEELQLALASLPIAANISYTQKVVKGIRCTSFNVDASASGPIRHLAEIADIIEGSDLSPEIKSQSLTVFNKLAAAEGSVHGVSPANIHFHEIGAVDTIVDVVGTFWCLASLGIKQIYTSALPWSGGFVDISHGRYPLPAPATALLLSGFPCVFSNVGMELVTPTGAALITSIASPLLDPPPFIPNRIAYGAGDYVRKDNVPNLLRLITGVFIAPSLQGEAVAVLETEVDDLNPEIFSHLYQLFGSHPAVLDFFTTPVYMKKNRPGSLITLITRPDSSEQLVQLLIQESGSLGVRYRLQKRYIASRSERPVDTPWGPVRVKFAHLPRGGMRAKPEFEDCQAIALRQNLPLLEVYSVINAIVSRLSE